MRIADPRRVVPLRPDLGRRKLETGPGFMEVRAEGARLEITACLRYPGFGVIYWINLIPDLGKEGVRKGGNR